MIFDFAQPDKLVPTQECLSSDNMRQYLDSSFSASKFGHVPVVRENGHFLMGGGHHRSAIVHYSNVAYGLGVRIPILICENDDELYNCFEGVLKSYCVKCFIDTFRKNSDTRRSRPRIPTYISDMPVDGHFNSLRLRGTKLLVVPDNEPSYLVSDLPPKEEILKLNRAVF